MIFVVSCISLILSYIYIYTRLTGKVHKLKSAYDDVISVDDFFFQVL